jgi:hypothetical protein
MVAPLLGGVYVVLLFLAGRALHSPSLGLIAAALGTISPMTRLIFSTMLSHALAATLITAALVLALEAGRSRGPLRAAAVGLFLGAAFGVRPLTAVAVAIPMLALTHHSRRTGSRFTSAGSTFLAFSFGFAVAAVPTLAANAQISGGALAFPYTLARGSMFGISNFFFGLRNLDALLISTGSVVTGWGWNFLHGPWTIALSFAPALVALITRRTRLTDWLLAAMIVCVAAAYTGTRGHGLHGYGPRYYFEIFAPFFLLTARGFFVLAGLGDPRERHEKRLPIVAAFGLFFALGLPAGAFLPVRLGLYRGYNGVDASLERQFEELELERAVIVLPTDSWQGWAAASRLSALGPDAPVLVIQTREDDPSIAAIAGDRRILVWRDGALEASP